MDCCVQGLACKFWGNGFGWRSSWLEQSRGGLILHKCLLCLISITERLNQDPHGMLFSQAFTHRGMSTVRLCARQEQWKKCPVIPPLPTLPPTSLAQETSQPSKQLQCLKWAALFPKTGWNTLIFTQDDLHEDCSVILQLLNSLPGGQQPTLSLRLQGPTCDSFHNPSSRGEVRIQQQYPGKGLRA